MKEHFRALLYTKESTKASLRRGHLGGNLNRVREKLEVWSKTNTTEGRASTEAHSQEAFGK